MPARLAAIVGKRDLLGLDAEHAAFGNNRTGNLDGGGGRGREQRRWRGKCVRPEGQILEQLVERRLARQGDGTNRSLPVEDGQAFEDVIDLLEAHGKLDR